MNHDSIKRLALQLKNKSVLSLLNLTLPKLSTISYPYLIFPAANQVKIIILPFIPR